MNKTLVFVHGLTSSHKLFVGQVPYFEKNYQLIVWDAPAHAKSRPYTEFNYPNVAEDLKGILDENNIDKAVLIGQSMGGYVVQSFILRYPERVSAFISIDSTPYGDYYSKSDKWWLRQVEWMSMLCPDNLLRKSIARQNTFTERSYKNTLTILESYNKKELCHLMGIAYTFLLKELSPLQIKCPTLLLVGEYDKTGKVLEYNRAWAQNTGFPLHIIQNAAHNSNDDNPDAVNGEIELFLKTLS